MSTRANYFKIGLFLLAGIALLLLGIVVLGAGALFERTFPAETYLDESAQGLSVGSPVKYLGVEVGTITDIAFAKSRYDTDYAYVLLDLEIKKKHFAHSLVTETQTWFRLEVKRGLRAKLAVQGLTGIAYLELGYEDPALARELAIDWEPGSLYIPSVPSVYTRVFDSVDKVFRRLEQTPIEEVVRDLDTFLTQLNEAIDSINVPKLRDEAQTTMEALRQSSERIRDLIHDPKLDSLPEHVAATAASARRMADTTEQDLRTILDGLQGAADKLNKVAGELESSLADGRLDSGVDNLHAATSNTLAATQSLPDSAERLNQTLARLDALVALHQRDLERILENLRITSDNLNAFTRDARYYPSRVLLGEPPEPPESTK